MKKTASTLEGYVWTSGRATGNTTRQIDLAINMLFNGYVVQVRDHHEDGNSFRANVRLFGLIMDRLKNEHSIVSDIIKVNKDKLTIELIP